MEAMSPSGDVRGEEGCCSRSVCIDDLSACVITDQAVCVCDRMAELV